MPLPFARRPTQTAPTFSRDFAGLKTLDHGVGPAINFTRASNATYFDASGTLQTAGTNVPRFDHDPATGASRGLLIEEARTNSIRNSQAGGAVVGVSGTAPTNWLLQTTQSGITREVAATGTENGMSYIDVRFVGTASSAATIFNAFESNTQIVATNGQTWTASAYFKLQSGSTSNISNLTIYCDEVDVSGNFLARSTTNLSPTSSSLSAQRSIVTRTFNNASTAYARTGFRFEVSSGLAIDITLRIAAPQLEQGAFATSYIPTTSAAATRAADSAVVEPISSFYNQAEGTLFAEFSRPQVIKYASFFGFNDPNSFFGDQCLLESGLAFPSIQRFQLTKNGVPQANIGNYANAQAGVVYRMAAGIAQNNFAVSQNGASCDTDESGEMTTVTRCLLGAILPSAAHIRKVAYWPKRLTNTLLQQLTT